VAPAVAAVLALVVAIMVWDFTHPYHNVRNLAAPGDTIVVLGDSIPAGFGDGVGPEHAWPALIANRLHLHIANRSIPGDTTAGGLKRLPDDVLAEHPRLLIVELGGNDYFAKDPPEHVQQNLQQIFEGAQAGGAMVMFVGVPTPMREDYQDAFKDATRHDGVYYYPNIMKGLLSDRSKMSDEIHPNAAGHEVIADRLQPVIEGLLAAGSHARGG
jgi:lysophospholipase L1-like esterase